MYHIPTSKCLQVFVGHECNSEGGGVTAGSFTPDGKFALSVGMDGTMRIWAPRTGLCRHVFKFSDGNGSATKDEDGSGGGLTCLAVDGGQDGQLAIAGGEDGSAYVVHLHGKKLVATLRHFDTASITVSDNGKSGMDMEEEMTMSSVEAVGFAPRAVNPNWVATGGSDGTIKVWDLTHGDGQCRQTCRPSEEPTVQGCGGITRILWHPTLPLLFASYADGAVRVWDSRRGALIHTLTGGPHSSLPDEANQINDLAVEFVNPECNGGTAVVITANDDGNVKIFEMNISKILADAAI